MALTPTQLQEIQQGTREIENRRISLSLTSPEHTLALRLAERHITPDVIMRFDIQQCGDGWTYPTPRGALRFKNANSQAPNKYAWIGEKRDTLLYADELMQAVQMKGGYVWLTTEFDFFAMCSAGIWNTIAQLQGEGTVPDELPAMLQEMGVLVCLIAPDRDNQGKAWAQLVADKLTPAGIEVFTRELPFPQTKKHGGDIGLAWKEHTSALSFEMYLLNLPTIKLHPTKQEEIIPKVEQVYSIADDIKSNIINALGVSRFNAKGYSKKIKCLFHNDTNPSAALHRDIGLHCFTCNRWYRWKDLAEILKLDWHTTTTPTPVHGELMLSDETRARFALGGCTALAMFLDAAYVSGWLPGRIFTRKDANALPLSAWTIRKAIEQMQGRGEDRRIYRKRIQSRNYSDSSGSSTTRSARPSSSSSKSSSKGFLLSYSPFFLYSKEGAYLNKKVSHRQAVAYKLPDPTDLDRLAGVTFPHYSPAKLPRSLSLCHA